jgi:lipid-A-disaccharide synthase-like uncharacterized protein
MLLQLSADFGDYLYEVFVANANWLLAFGLAGQFLFAARFIVQWLESEREGRSVVPVAFWYLSLAGGLMTLIYGLVKREPVIILGQAPSIFIYTRNLMLIRRERRRAATSGAAGGAIPPSDGRTRRPDPP